MKDLKKYFKVQIPDGYEIDVEQSTFENIVFKQIRFVYPTSWEDAFINQRIYGFIFQHNSELYYYNKIADFRDKNVFRKEKQARKALAYAQITQLMALSCYNGDWTPDWNDGEEKYIIVRYGNNIVKDTIYRIYREISFRTEESRDAFFSNHMDLLRTYFELN